MMKKPRPPNQRGAVLLVLLFILFLITVLMISLSLLHRSDLEIVTNHIEDQTAFYCAEYGIERAYYEIRAVPPGIPNWWPPGNPFSGVVWNNQNCYTNTPQGMIATSNKYTLYITETHLDPNDTGPYNHLWIISVGTTANGFSRTIRVLVRRSRRAQTILSPPEHYYLQVLRYEEL